jgi:hypothetical protein
MNKEVIKRNRKNACNGQKNAASGVKRQAAIDEDGSG